MQTRLVGQLRVCVFGVGIEEEGWLALKGGRGLAPINPTGPSGCNYETLQFLPCRCAQRCSREMGQVRNTTAQALVLALVGVSAYVVKAKKYAISPVK